MSYAYALVQGRSFMSCLATGRRVNSLEAVADMSRACYQVEVSFCSLLLDMEK